MSKWPIRQLKGHVVEISQRKGEATAEVLSVTNTVGFVRSLDVFDKQVYSEDTSAYKMVSYDDIAYNPSRINVGSVARCEFKAGGAVSPMYVVIRCRPTLLPAYLLYFLKSEVGQTHVRHRCEGAVRFQLRYSDLEQIEAPLPPLSEQARVVGILDEVEALRHLRAQADERVSALQQMLFTSMFGDPVANPKGWPASTFDEHLEIIEYGPRFHNEAYSPTGTRIVRITDLDNSGNLDFSAMPRIDVDAATIEKRALKPGELVFARSGATVGKVAVVPDGTPPCIAGAYFIRLRFRRAIHPMYAFYLIKHPSVQQIITSNSKQSAQPNFSGPGIRSLPLPVPPIEEQEKFAARLSEIRGLKDMQVNSRQRLENLIQSLLQRAFRGVL